MNTKNPNQYKSNGSGFLVNKILLSQGLSGFANNHAEDCLFVSLDHQF